MGRRAWFLFWINGRTSKFAHSLAIEWASAADGRATALCGANAYDVAPDPRTVGFVSARDSDRRCPDCLAASGAA